MLFMPTGSVGFWTSQFSQGPYQFIVFGSSIKGVDESLSTVAEKQHELSRKHLRITTPAAASGDPESTGIGYAMTQTEQSLSDTG